MKKLVVLSIIMIGLYSCSSKKKTVETNVLYEILKSDDQGGGSFQFYELITQKQEFNILLSDKELKTKIDKDDILKSNFILLNMGEKPSGGYYFTIENVVETKDNIIVTVKENVTKGNVETVITYPLTVVKINSKKDIIIK